MRIHLFNDLPSVCRNCCFKCFRDEGNASWYYCSVQGDPFAQPCENVFVNSFDGYCPEFFSCDELLEWLEYIDIFDDSSNSRLISLVKSYGI